MGRQMMPEGEMPCFDVVFFGTVWRGAAEIVLARRKDSSCSVGMCESLRQTRNDGWLEPGMLVEAAGWVIMAKVTANNGAVVHDWKQDHIVFRRDKGLLASVDRHQRRETKQGRPAFPPAIHARMLVVWTSAGAGGGAKGSKNRIELGWCFRAGRQTVCGTTMWYNYVVLCTPY
jgi:hypothetical protein